MRIKKWLISLLALALALSFVACGGAKEPAAAPAAAPAAEAPAAEAPAAEPAAEPAEEPAAKEELTYTLDYDSIAAWVDGGYLGMSDAGEAILLVFNADMTMAGMVFGDPESGSAVSFFGEMVDNGDGSVTINDEINGLSMTFGVEQVSDTVMALDMGEELGAAQIEAAPLDTLLESLQGAIENFNHVA